MNDDFSKRAPKHILYSCPCVTEGIIRFWRPVELVGDQLNGHFSGKWKVAEIHQHQHREIPIERKSESVSQGCEKGFRNA